MNHSTYPPKTGQYENHTHVQGQVLYRDKHPIAGPDIQYRAPDRQSRFIRVTELEPSIYNSIVCCVFRPANACLRMHLHGRK